MALQEHLEFLATETAFWMLGLQDPQCPMDQLGSLSEKVSDQLRALAIITLLAEGDTDLFYHNLLRSGLAQITFLERCRREGFRDFHLAISRSKAFFDVLAARDFDMARRLADLSPREWIPEGEYEDDFCYARFCHRMIQGGETAAEAGALMARFESALEGHDDARLDLLKALAAEDQDAFDDAFEGLLADHENQLESDKTRGRMEDPEVLAERQIFVEGLGILNLAEMLGFRTREAYQFCPSFARDPMTIPFPGL